MNPYDLIKIPCKLTLPINAAQEIKLPQLSTYSSEWFRLNAAQNGVVFKARTDGAHTSGSKNPRSELREMKADGSPAAWSSTTGLHSMRVKCSVDVLPIGSKPQVVTGQIHNVSDDVSVFRVEGNFVGKVYGANQYATIWLTDGDKTHGHKLIDNYKLGDVFDFGFIVENGLIEYIFNGKPVLNADGTPYVQKKSFSGAYFKTGDYNQSGGIITKLADGAADYAQVTLYAVQVCHDGVCTGNAPGSGVTVTVDPPVVPPVTVDPLQPIIDGMQAIIAEAQDAIVKLTGLKL